MKTPEERGINGLIEMLDNAWHEAYADIVAQHKAISEKKRTHKDYIKLTKQEVEDISGPLGELIALSNLMIDWGKELESDKRVAWAKNLMASLTGFKDGQEFDRNLREEVAAKEAKFGQS